MFGRVLNTPLRKHCFPAGNYMFKVNNRNTRTNFTVLVFIVNFEQVNAGWVMNTKLKVH